MTRRDSHPHFIFFPHFSLSILILLLASLHPLKHSLSAELYHFIHFLWLHSTSWSSCWHGERVLLGLSTGWSIPSTTFQLLRLRFQTIFTRRCEKNDKWKKSSKFSTDSLSKRTERPRTLTPTETQVGSCQTTLRSQFRRKSFQLSTDSMTMMASASQVRLDAAKGTSMRSFPGTRL